MFIGRDREIAFLESWYTSGFSNTVTLYGKSGLGKTALLKEFAKAKPHFYYAAREAIESVQLRLFAKQLIRSKKPESEVSMDWYTAFSAIPPESLIILDNFQHMMKNPEVLSIIQNPDFGRRLILCTDSKLDSDTAELQLKPLSFYEATAFFPRCSPFDQMMLYASFGGIPKHLSHLDPTLSMEQNIKQKLLNFKSHLFFEAEAMMKQDLREAAVYNTIMAEIAAGCTQISQLHNITGISKTKLSVYLKNLIHFGLLKREVSLSPPGLLSTNGVWGQYKISNHLMRFWFTFVFPNLSDLLWSNLDSVYREKILPNMDAYIAQVFAEICTDYLRVSNDKGLLPFSFINIGRWWRGGLSLDILATGNGGEYLMGLCRYSSVEMEFPEYQKAKARFDSVDPDKSGLRYLFCNAGFTEDIRRNAPSDGIILISFYGTILQI